MTIVKEPKNYRQIPFKKLYKMYGDYIEMDYSYCCICMITKERWANIRIDSNNLIVDDVKNVFAP